MVARKNNRRVKPVVEQTYKLSDLPTALQEKALDLAQGDIHRITIVKTTEVVIENRPR